MISHWIPAERASELLENQALTAPENGYHDAGHPAQHDRIAGTFL